MADDKNKKPEWSENGHRGVTAEQKADLLARMDVTMVQKLAFASAHFHLHDGARLLDIGCARGLGSYNLALLNPRLQVVGMDYDASYIEEAQKTYKLPNLTFVQGDARKIELPGKFDAIFNSSLMHEVFSFSGYDKNAAVSSLRSQFKKIKNGDTLLLRDFNMPEDPDAMVYLDLPVSESKGTHPRDLSYPDLLRHYSRIANALKPETERGFYLEDKGTTDGTWHRFYLPARWAHEFIWRKEYRDRFDIEAQEQYSFWTASDYRRAPEPLGARATYTAPYANPWIHKNWHKDKYRLFNDRMEELNGPASNFIAVFIKAAKGEGLHLREHRLSAEAPKYLREDHFMNSVTGDRYDIVSRPGAVYDVLPYAWNKQGHLVVYAKSGYPRPLINAMPRNMTPNLDGKHWSGHIVEPLSIANGADMASAVQSVLKDRAGFKKTDKIKTSLALTYYTAPADVNEKVDSVFAEVPYAGYEKKLKGPFSGFASDGTVRAFEVQDILRSMQVGMVAEARLELNIYALMHKLGVTPYNWIGETYNIQPANVKPVALDTLLKPAIAKPFVATAQGSGYFKTVRSQFVEEAAGGKVIAARELEFIVPANDLTTNFVTAVPLVRDPKSGEMLIGVRVRDLPTAQEQEGCARILTLPTFRLPPSVHDLREAKAYVAKSTGGQVDALGESYFPSTGIMPGRVYPMLVTGESAHLQGQCQHIKLSEAFQNLEKLRDANLMIAVQRTVHALGLWEQYCKPAPNNSLAPAGEG